jgi:site-specific recombinase XerD
MHLSPARAIIGPTMSNQEQTPLFPLLEKTGNRLTIKAYVEDVQHFQAFAESKPYDQTIDKPPISTDLLVAYILLLGARRQAWSTIRRRLVGLANWYIEHDVRDTHGVIVDPRREIPVQRAIEAVKLDGARAKARRPAATERLVHTILDQLDADYDSHIRPAKQVTLTFLRDRALVLTLFAGGLTRTEASTLRADHIIADPQDRSNLLLTVNPTGEVHNAKGQLLGWAVPARSRVVKLERTEDPNRDPVRALTQWMKYAGIQEDEYVFRGVTLDGGLTKQLAPRSVQHVIAARRALVDDSGSLKGVSPHSLRLGRAGTLARDGASLRDIGDALGIAKPRRQKSDEPAKEPIFDDSLVDVIAKGRQLQGRPLNREPLTL